MLLSQIPIKKRSLKNCLSLSNPFCFNSRYSLAVAAIFFAFICRSQQITNYVSNGGFESLNSNSVTSYFNTLNYWQPIDTTKACDYLATVRPPIANAPGVFGWQYARTGDNYIVTTFFCSTCSSNPRSYPRNRLKQFLQAGKTYCVKFHIVNTNNTTLGIENTGAYFGGSGIDTITKCTDPITYLNPQVLNTNGVITDTMNWVPITGTFVANGTEKYMVLGNFKSDVNTNTLLINPTYLPNKINDICIDDVSCIDIDLPAYAGPGPNTWCIPGDSVFIGRQPDVGIDEACMWYKLPDMTNAIDTVAGLWVKPIVTTTYVVKQEICAGIKYDTIVVHQSGTGIKESKLLSESLNIYPIPAKDQLNLHFDADVQGKFESVSIFNSLGQLIREEEIKFSDRSAILKINELPNGVYLITLKGKNDLSISKRFTVAQ